MKIKITQTKEKWLISFGLGGHPRKFASATTLYLALERRLSKSPKLHLKEKTSIEVKLMDNTTNETLVSINARYLLITTLIFLEENIGKELFKKEFRKYGGEIDNYESD